MPDRYLLLTGGSPERRSAAIARLGDIPFRTILDSPAALMIADPQAQAIALGNGGAVIGPLFTRGRSGPLEEMPGTGAYSALASRGQHLIDRYWGGYVAVLPTGDGGLDIVRAPFGWLPCFYTVSDGLTAFASDVGMLIASGLYAPRADPAALARHLAAGDVRRNETCLVGLTELRGGDRWSSDEGLATLWSPWTFAGERFRLDDPVEAERRLRDTALYCVGERTPKDAMTLLLLSGGLDSSIVAACLAANGRAVTGLTYVTENPAGDERRYARAVTDHIGAALEEGFCAAEGVDLTRSEAAHLPRPIARAFEQRTNALLRTSAARVSAGAIVGGGGGDNLFCALQSPAPAADCLIDPAGRARFWPTAGSIAEMTQASVLTVARRAWWRTMRPRPYRRHADTSFLSSAAIALAEGALDHPWLRAPRGILPGKAAHAALLIGAQGFVEDSDPLSTVAAQAVLMSQPLVETCLSIPSWQWFERGRNRAAARRAFEHALPPEIAWRRGKGSPDGFLVELFEQQRPLIRSLLLDGVLASHGLLDARAVAAELDDPRPAYGHSFARLMQLLDAETWTRNWPL